MKEEDEYYDEEDKEYCREEEEYQARYYCEGEIDCDKESKENNCDEENDCDEVNDHDEDKQCHGKEEKEFKQLALSETESEDGQEMSMIVKV